MLDILDIRDRHLNNLDLSRFVPRPAVDIHSVAEAVSGIIADVRERGAEALVEQAQRFDHVEHPVLTVEQARIEEAVLGLDPRVRSACETAIERVRAATAVQLREPQVTRFGAGSTVTQRWRPVRRAGLYVPGGKAVYPSSVIMNVVPAQVAGVRQIVLVSPAQRAFGGSVHPLILATAGLLGVREVYAIGGAGAIAALAYGVSSIGLAPVDVISGPGNAFVAAAKSQVSADCGIDSVAGPTEILVLADETADPQFVAADLLSQAEHDEQASSVLVSPSADLVAAVREALATRLSQTQNRERAGAALDGPQSRAVITASWADAIAVANAYAPEHLEILSQHPEADVEAIDNAGAIFLGPYSPVPLGDYAAGSNHVLPTGGQARFQSALGAYTFLRPQQVIHYDRDGLEQVGDAIRTLADAELLPAHGASITARLARSGRRDQR